MNIHIYAFDDLDMCRGAIESVRDIDPAIPIHVFDGRHADFPGAQNLTDGLKAHCIGVDACYYHAPDDEDLPFGQRHALHKRGAGYAKSRFAFKHLPPDEWTLKLDTDERLRQLQPARIDIEADRKYAVPIEEANAQDTLYPTRLFKPGRWTPWVGDTLVPRELFPLDHSLDALTALWTDDRYRTIRFIGHAICDAIEIDNIGDERPPEYQERRAKQLRIRQRETLARERASSQDRGDSPTPSHPND